jgi:hypothetical protein
MLSLRTRLAIPRVAPRYIALLTPQRADAYSPFDPPGAGHARRWSEASTLLRRRRRETPGVSPPTLRASFLRLVGAAGQFVRGNGTDKLRPAARPQRWRGGRRMSSGGLFAGTGPDGGDGPSQSWPSRRCPEDASATVSLARFRTQPRAHWLA